jgi:predicted transposase/invertase (TIGR01784 family)
MQNPHDKLFKETFNNPQVTKDFVTYYLPPAIVKQIDVNTIEPQKDSFINKELEEVFSDLLFKVDINHEQGYLYLLFEHKSYQSRDIAVQLLEYMLRIWKRQPLRKGADKLPIILPLVIYHGKQTWHMGQSLGVVIKGFDTLTDDMARYVPDFDYLLFDVSTYQDAKIKGVAQLKILFTIWRDLYTKNSADLKTSIYQAAEALNALEEKTSGLNYFETLLRYVFSTSDAFTKNDIRDIVKTLEQAYPEGSDVMKTIADVLREEGIEQGIEQGIAQGIEQGIAQGKQQGIAESLLMMLDDKVGQIPEDMQKHIYLLDEQKLKVIFKNLHQIETLTDLNSYL